MMACWRLALLVAALAATAEGFGLAPALGLWRAPAAASQGRHGRFVQATRPGNPCRGMAGLVAMQDGGEWPESPILKNYAGRIVKIADPEDWVMIQKVAELKQAILLAEFRAMSCRKCMALEGKYHKLPKKFEGRAVLFVEVDAQKVGKQVREEAGVVKVPAFQIWVDGAMVEGYLAEDVGVTMGKVEAMVQRNLHLAKGHDFFRGVTAVSPEPEPEEAAPVDPLASWRKHQSALLRAPGFSSSQSSTTLLRTEGGGEGGADEEPAAPEAGAGVGASSQDLLSELEAVKVVAQKANGQSAVTNTASGAVEPPPASRMANGGGSTREELLAQLEAITAKKKQG